MVSNWISTVCQLRRVSGSSSNSISRANYTHLTHLLSSSDGLDTQSSPPARPHDRVLLWSDGQAVFNQSSSPLPRQLVFDGLVGNRNTPRLSELRLSWSLVLGCRCVYPFPEPAHEELSRLSYENYVWVGVHDHFVKYFVRLLTLSYIHAVRRKTEILERIKAYFERGDKRVTELVEARAYVVRF